MQSETADNIIWTRYSLSSETDSLDSITQDALSRIEWQEIMTPTPLRSVLEHATTLENSTAERRSRLMIVAGQRLVLDLRKVTDAHDGLSTTRVGREVERAIEALGPSRSPSPIVFVDHRSGYTPAPGTPTSPGRARPDLVELGPLVPSPGGGSRRSSAVVLELAGLARDGRRGDACA